MQERTRRSITRLLCGLPAGVALLVVLAIFSVSLARAETVEFSNPAPLQIPAATPCCTAKPASIYPSSMNVSGLNGVTRKVTVTLHGLSDENLDDMAVLLVGPSGGGVVLMASYDGGRANAWTVTFEEAAPPLECEPVGFPTGSGVGPHNCGLLAPFPIPAPAGPYGYLLEALGNDGVWSLYVDNDSGTQEASIAGGWSLRIETLATTPYNTARPTISGTGQPGQTLSCEPGSWLGLPPPSAFGYQWQRDGSSIAGATSQSYVVQNVDEGHTLTCEVTASSNVGRQTATSAGVAIPIVGSPVAPTGPVTNPASSVRVTASQIAAMLGAQLTSSGKSARSTALLKDGAFTASFHAPVGGTVVIDWYQAPGGGTLARSKPGPLLVASGRLTLPAAGAATIEVKLTAQGKRLLKQAKQLKLTAKGTFSPIGMVPITVTRTFLFKR